MKRMIGTRNGAVWRLGLILLLPTALWPLSLRAETPVGAPIGRFVIGVWSPAGWSGAKLNSYDRRRYSRGPGRSPPGVGPMPDLAKQGPHGDLGHRR